MRRIILVLLALVPMVVFTWIVFGGMTIEEAPYGEPAPGREWSGQGRYGISEAEAAAFHEFPLLWLGPSFAGYNLQAIDVRDAPPFPLAGSWPRQEFLFIYGTCERDGGFLRSDACSGPIPLYLQVRSACEGSGFGQDDVIVRGGAVFRPGESGSLAGTPDEQRPKLWTGKTQIVIVADSVPDQVDAIVEALHAVDGEGLAAGEPLPEPDRSGCD